jgi:plastocyanin
LTRAAEARSTLAPSGSVEAHVHIEDGSTIEAYRFVPELLLVRSGAVVEYHNHGALPHTATLQTH